MRLQLLRTDSTHPDFSRLLPILDAELRSRYGASQEFFDQFNQVDSIRNVVVAYLEGQPSGCGSFKPFDLTTVEIKRMFVLNDKRGRGMNWSVGHLSLVTEILFSKQASISRKRFIYIIELVIPSFRITASMLV